MMTATRMMFVLNTRYKKQFPTMVHGLNIIGCRQSKCLRHCFYHILFRHTPKGAKVPEEVSAVMHVWYDSPSEDNKYELLAKIEPDS